MTHGKMVLLQGKLYGAGHQSQCELIARELSTDSGKSYKDCAVISSPAIPDGEYTVFFEGHFAAVKRLRGRWAVLGNPQHI